MLLEAAGYDTCLVETVGVGQSETLVSEMVDMFVLLVPPAGGDELQGMKRGIMEFCDLVLINKADGPLKTLAKLSASDYASGLHYSMGRHIKWQPRVLCVSAREASGLAEAWEVMTEYRTFLTVVISVGG